MLNSNHPLRLSCTAVALVAFGATTASSVTATAQKRCKGSKVFYAGQCRYPDEVNTLRRQAQARADAKRKADAERQRERAEQQRLARDDAACTIARKAKSEAGWAAYLEAHPDGGCVDEGKRLITTIRAQAQPSPSPPPPPPVPIVPPPGGGGEAEVREGGIPTFAWIGFGVAGAGVVSATVAGVITASRANSLDEQCLAGRCPQSAQPDLDAANLSAHVTTASIIVAGLGGAVGIVGLIVGATSGSENHTRRVDETVDVTIWRSLRIEATGLPGGGAWISARARF